MKYVCSVCGYVYDEEAEGVKWEDLGDDFVCPLCGVGKDMFEEQQDSWKFHLIIGQVDQLKIGAVKVQSLFFYK